MGNGENLVRLHMSFDGLREPHRPGDRVDGFDLFPGKPVGPRFDSVGSVHRSGSEHYRHVKTGFYACQRGKDGGGLHLAAILSAFNLADVAHDQQTLEPEATQAVQFTKEPGAVVTRAAPHQVGDGFALDGELLLRTDERVVSRLQSANARCQAGEELWCLFAGFDDDLGTHVSQVPESAKGRKSWQGFGGHREMVISTPCRRIHGPGVSMRYKSCRVRSSAARGLARVSVHRYHHNPHPSHYI